MLEERASRLSGRVVGDAGEGPAGCSPVPPNSPLWEHLQLIGQLMADPQPPRRWEGRGELRGFAGGLAWGCLDSSRLCGPSSRSSSGRARRPCRGNSLHGAVTPGLMAGRRVRILPKPVFFPPPRSPEAPLEVQWVMNCTPQPWEEALA